MSKIVVLGLQHQTYTSRRGDLVEKLLCHYFDPFENHKSKLERGFRLLNQNIVGSFSFESFKTLPGIYEVTSEPTLGPGGKLAVKFTSMNFVGDWEIDRASQGYLFLSAKKIDFQTKEGENIRGIKLFFLNPRDYLSDDETEGYAPLEAFIPTSKLALSELPGFYNCQFNEIRGARGIAMAKIIPDSVTLIAAFSNLEYQQAQEQVV